MVLAFLYDMLQVVWIDLILSADNSLLIGLAASALPVHERNRVIFWGIAFAVVMRILFAIAVTWLLAIKGILFFAGLLLAWISWRLYTDIRSNQHKDIDLDLSKTQKDEVPTEKSSIFSPSMRRAIFSIFVADISMSLDNVVSVAAIARNNIIVLVFGLALSIVLMGIGSTLVTKLISRYRWISYIGLAFLLFLSADMIISGSPELLLLF